MRESSLFEFPVSIVKHYLYCPKIPYFIFNLGIKERTTELMISGEEKHKRRLRKLGEEGWNVNVFLKSKKFGIYGYIDAFKEEDGLYIVLEIKNTSYRKKVVKPHLYQTACYALMVEENFGRVKEIILEYDDREIKFPFTLGIKKYCISIINKVRRIAQGELVSCKTEKKKCENCGFLRFCLGL